MNKPEKNSLDLALENVLLRPWYRGNNENFVTLVHLCGFYDDGEMPPEVRSDLDKVNECLIDIDLMLGLDKVISNVYKWHRLFGDPPKLELIEDEQGFHMSSDHAVNKHLTPLTDQIDTIFEKVDENDFDISRLTRYVAHKAREAGHLREDYPEWVFK